MSALWWEVGEDEIDAALQEERAQQDPREPCKACSGVGGAPYYGMCSDCMGIGDLPTERDPS